jgi:hypothetical protein
MVSNMESRFDLAFQFPRFAKQLQLVHVVCDEAANLNPLVFDPPLSDCTYGRQRPHSPSYVRRPLILESHDQLMWQSHHSKHSDCYREQRLLGEIMALHGGMESLQIYLI